jgi:hypothetical protein
MNSHAQRRLAIVGGGAAGVAVFIAAVQRRTADRIFVIEPGLIGPGVAFAPSDPDLICNTSVDIMSIVPGKPLDFLDYLTAKRYPATEESFVPRRIYGDYLTDRFDRYARLARQRGIEVTHLPYRFKALKRLGDRRYALVFREPAPAVELTVSDVVFCTGGGSPRVPRALAPHRGHPHFVSCPYDEEEMRTKVAPNAQVLVIGSKLSAIDASMLLCRAGHRVTMLSPSGRLPAVRARFLRGKEVPVDVERLASVMARWDGRADTPLPGSLLFGYRRYFARALHAYTKRSWRTQLSLADRFDDRLREEIAIAESGGAAWEDWVVNFVNTANSIYLDHGDRFATGFHHAFCPILFEYLAAVAMPNARKLRQYTDRARLTVERGELRRVTAAHGNRSAFHVDWGQGERRFDAVVSAAGFHAPHYVVNAEGDIEVEIDGRGNGEAIRVSAGLCARIPRWPQKESIWLLGASLHGRLLTASAIFIITDLADQIAAGMLARPLPDDTRHEGRVGDRQLAMATTA